MIDEGRDIEKSSRDLFWPTFAFVCGVLAGASFTTKVAQILLFLATLLLHRSWIIFAMLAIAVACYFSLKYLGQIERLRLETVLSEEHYEQIKLEIETDLATKTRHVDSLIQTVKSQHQRLQKISGGIIQQTDELQQNQTSFIFFVEQVSGLLGRRSKKLQNEFPDNPIQLEKIQQRDQKLHAELNDVLQSIAETFPELAGSIPVPEPESVDEHMETLYLQQPKPKSGKIAEYRRKRVKVAKGSKSTRRR